MNSYETTDKNSFVDYVLTLVVLDRKQKGNILNITAANIARI